MSGFVGGVFGKFLGSIFKTVFEWFAIYRSGEKAQANRDQSATLDALIRERDAAERSPGTIDEMADDARRGKL